ncbi:hypothetical protein EDB81DRAFT_308492 [Dactylonectria macrodidyma]|uniref:Nephrocystin 3-like N-terminal domain-containing protein n=1 Tax=Dactylonectria macrodidyma TaxID=307937 RepID=A0A9P9D6M0_9HYPO|nr:hypothetical protein EDB81DRAFT_308492 [Dactylonectria macrodidyma]
MTSRAPRSVKYFSENSGKQIGGLLMPICETNFNFPLETTVSTQKFSQIIQGLHFSGIETREKAIPKPYEATYEGIFRNGYNNGQDSLAGGRNSFYRWLEDCSSKVYWITGKLGSGKSTLMNFVVHNPLTQKHLQAWAGNLPLLLGLFYFWEAGQDNLQKSREGLIQTLLWQCLQSRPDMIPRVTPGRWTAHHVLHGLETPAPA